MKGLTIGQVAKAANVNMETVKFYERKELISKPPRTQSGYRIYPENVLDEIAFIKQAQEIGFTLLEIKQLRSILRDDDHFPAEEMYAYAKAKVKEMEQKIARLERFKTMLEQVTKLPEEALPLSKGNCPILKTWMRG
ncbi:MerR family transcriptional regulator [Paenibacillus nanensis]|uniref:MerR family transcriptional regulator n=1 Tax=Paenibacillus nanensis TaxID=393251 RepID=A0A3A1UNM5_9BACL|nr:MerR family transcriptional regulator [Paenibacillus nanensis]RIX50167.1 MerR family transcriptional regulator [Paenibacillus nanensis]